MMCFVGKKRDETSVQVVEGNHIIKIDNNNNNEEGS